MAPKQACIIRPGPGVCPGQIAFTLRIPGGGTPLRFTRGTVDERRAMLDEAQVAALRGAGYWVTADQTAEEIAALRERGIEVTPNSVLIRAAQETVRTIEALDMAVGSGARGRREAGRPPAEEAPPPRRGKKAGKAPAEA